MAKCTGGFYRPQGKVMFSQASVILSTIGLMPTRSLLILVGYSVNCYSVVSVRKGKVFTSMFQEFCPGVYTPLGRHPLDRLPPQADTPPGQTPPLSRHPLGRHPHTPWADTTLADGYCSGPCASYWNAFLFNKELHR